MTVLADRLPRIAVFRIVLSREDVCKLKSIMGRRLRRQ